MRTFQAQIAYIAHCYQKVLSTCLVSSGLVLFYNILIPGSFRRQYRTFCTEQFIYVKCNVADRATKDQSTGHVWFGFHPTEWGAHWSGPVDHSKRGTNLGCTSAKEDRLKVDGCQTGPNHLWTCGFHIKYQMGWFSVPTSRNCGFVTALTHPVNPWVAMAEACQLYLGSTLRWEWICISLAKAPWGKGFALSHLSDGCSCYPDSCSSKHSSSGEFNILLIFNIWLFVTAMGLGCCGSFKVSRCSCIRSWWLRWWPGLKM